MKRYLYLTFAAIFALAGCEKPSDSQSISIPDPRTIDIGVEIGGVVWATRNVAAPGFFADNRYDLGMHYQWGQNVAWSAVENNTSSPFGADWLNVITNGDLDVWGAATDPCPAGWHVPTAEDFETLYYDVDSEWIIENGVTGRVFGVGDSSIFLPAAGYSVGGQAIVWGGDANYWSCESTGGTGFCLRFDADYVYRDFDYPTIYLPVLTCGFSIRCVR